jgi:hypothetical protein
MSYKRRDDGGWFELQSVNPWYFRIESNQVSWKGSKPGSSSQGTSPGKRFRRARRAGRLQDPQPLVEGGYTTRAMHFDLSWMLSKFENSNDGLLDERLLRQRAGQDPPRRRQPIHAGDGQRDVRDLPAHTTVAARFTTDELKDSVALDANVLNGTGGQIVPTGPSAGTFDGKVKNTTFTVSAASAPTKGLDTKVYYNYRKRDEESPEVTFSSSSLGTYVAEPFSYEKNNWGFDAYYRFNRGNRFGGGYDYLDTKREGRDDFDRTKDKRLSSSTRTPCSTTSLGA